MTPEYAKYVDSKLKDPKDKKRAKDVLKALQRPSGDPKRDSAKKWLKEKKIRTPEEFAKGSGKSGSGGGGSGSGSGGSSGKASSGDSGGGGGSSGSGSGKSGDSGGGDTKGKSGKYEIGIGILCTYE